MSKNPWFCWIGPYNAHCFRNDKGEPMKPDGSCWFCGDPDPDAAPVDGSPDQPTEGSDRE